MNKLIRSVIAVAALAAGGAFAQTAECQRGIEGGVWADPCGLQSSTARDPWGRPYVQPGLYGYPAASVLSQIFGSNAYPYAYQVPQVVPQYNATRRDRDGDGVRNRHDRYPNDPRYR